MVKYDIAAMHLLLYGIITSLIMMSNSESTTECEYCPPAYISHCAPGQYYSNETSSCRTCPSLHEYCRASKCCISPDIMYCDSKSNIPQCKCKSGEYECSENSADHTNVMMAAQIALIIALIISATAFAVLIFKTCRRRARILRNRLRRQQQQRDSLSSIQRFVIERLQNRPPRYDDTGHIPIEKPPTYQEAVQAPDSESVNEVWYIHPQQDSNEGIDNPVFTISGPEAMYYENAAYSGQPPDCDSLPFSNSSTVTDDYLYPRMLDPNSESVLKDLPAQIENVASNSVTVTIQCNAKINNSDNNNTTSLCANEAVAQSNKNSNEIKSDLNELSNENDLHFQKSCSECNKTNCLNSNVCICVDDHENFSSRTEQSTSL